MASINDSMKNGMKKQRPLILLLLAGCLFLSACGQKGPLFLPESERQTKESS